MTPRINIHALQPEAYNAMFSLENYLETSTLDPLLMDLVRSRASLVNGCAFCINMHTESARGRGEVEERLAALSDWRASPLFSDREKAVLAVTDQVTLIADRGLEDETYHHARRFLSETEMAQLIMLVATINAWNRIGIATRLQPE